MKTKFKKFIPVLVLLIATILATSCETQEEAISKENKYSVNADNDINKNCID